MYSEKVMDHFANPRNVGEIENADGVGEVGNPQCGDIMRMSLRIQNGVIEDVKFRTFGCGAAIATSSIATEMIKGKSIEDALKLTNKAVVERSTDCPPSRCTAAFWRSRPSRRPSRTITAARVSIPSPSWASWKKTATPAAAACDTTDRRFGR